MANTTIPQLAQISALTGNELMEIVPIGPTGAYGASMRAPTALLAQLTTGPTGPTGPAGYGVSGTFTATITGMTTTTTGTINYSINGNICVLTALNAILGTSNSIAMSLTNLPSQCVPTTGGPIVPCWVQPGSGYSIALAGAIVNGNTVYFLFPVTLTTAGINLSGEFPGSGTAGVPVGWTITYPLF